MSLPAPYKFGKYVIVGKIAQGGMAEIYRAKYLGEGGFVKEVAVKRILPVWSDNKEFVTMLCDEAKALVNLQHQNIVQIYELGKDGETFYISMEFVDGVDLRKYFRRISDFSSGLKYACFIVSEILKGLSFAHDRKDKNGNPLEIIHRDVSPQNILLSYSGEVKIADFGIAKGAHRSFETAVAQVKGKYAYMSPEQASGGQVDARTDVYAVGVIFYELLSGKRLYDAANDLLTIEQVKKSVLPDGWENGIPMGARPIIRKALTRQIEKRYQTAADFLGELNRYVAANKLMTHGIEFSVHLRELFKEEYERSLREEDSVEEAKDGFRPQTKILSVISRSGVEEKSKRAYFAVVAAVAVVVAISALFAWNRLHNALPETVANQPAGNNANLHVPAIPPAPPSPSQAESRKAPAKQAEAASVPVAVSDGTLNVHARPWGYVYVPGVVDRKETPLKGLKLKQGDYVVKVNYEPDDKWVQQKITIAANSNTTCLANFGVESNLTCKTVK